MKPTVDKPKPRELRIEARNKTRNEAGNEAGGARSEVRCEEQPEIVPMEELQKKLGSSPDGLSQAEAKKRLAQYGPNEIAEKKDNPFLKFLTYFWGPIPWMIEGAVILSGAVRHWPDFFIILLLLLSNAVVGFWEEHQAGNAIAALKSKLAIKAKVKRDGKWTDPSAKRAGAGRRHPPATRRYCSGRRAFAGGRPRRGGPVRADGRIFTRQKKPGDAVFSGSIIRQGESEANGLCHGHEHLLRQDRANGAGGRKPSAISREPC